MNWWVTNVHAASGLAIHAGHAVVAVVHVAVAHHVMRVIVMGVVHDASKIEELLYGFELMQALPEGPGDDGTGVVVSNW